MASSIHVSASSEDVRSLKIAVEGCGHGSLDIIYDSIREACATKGWSLSDLDFLLICGDFQAVRNPLDLNSMSVPPTYRHLGDFHKYYSGASTAPLLTLVVGGNHEASNYLFELYHGGWLAPNIYYLGAANVIRYGPYRIAGLSGIFNSKNYRKPHGERLPYTKDDIRSIYHVREFEVRKLLQLKSQVDVGASHDWPSNIELFGDFGRLFEDKPHFLESAKKDTAGSKPAAMVLNHLRPGHWFSGHMHTKFEAVVEFTGERFEDSIRGLRVPGELKESLPIFREKEGGRRPGNEKRAPPLPADVKNTRTEFLALGKVGPENEFLELKEIDLCSPTSSTDDSCYYKKDEDGKFFLQYDAEWLAVTRAFNNGLMIKDSITREMRAGEPEKASVARLSKDLKWVQENIVEKDLLRVPSNFAIHAPVYEVDTEVVGGDQQSIEYENSQTTRFCELLQVKNKFALTKERS